jgi:hypothetical protein
MDIQQRQHGRIRELMPWRVAKSLYGPYKLSKHFELENHDDVYLVGDVQIKHIRPALQRALSVRTLLTLGVLVTLVRWISAPKGLDEAVNDWGKHAIMSTLFGPIGVAIGAAALVLLARPGHRPATRRALRRPIGVAMLTVLVMVVILSGALEPLRIALRSLPPPLPLLHVVLFGWVAVFLACMLYLVHHNGLAHRGHPLLRPITTTFLAWASAILPLVVRIEGLEPTPGVVTAALVGSTLATMISVWEWRAAQRGR